MKARRKTIARAAAVLGTACVLITPLAPGAAAQQEAVAVYETQGSGQALVVAFQLSPNILLESAISPGFGYADASISDVNDGSGLAVAALPFPGKFGIGAVGCSGLPGSPWVQAFYPPITATNPNTGQRINCPSHMESTAFQTSRSHFGQDMGQPHLDAPFNAIADRLSARAGHIEATAMQRGANSVSEGKNIVLRPTPEAAPVIQIRSLRISTETGARTSSVHHRVTVLAQDVELLGGIIKIGSFIARAETSSDGVTGTAKGTLTFNDTRAEVQGREHAITIDNDGVHVSDSPELSREQELGIQEAIDEAMLNASITITAARPVEIVEGTRAEATMGGLVLAFGGRIPSVQVPDQLAPVLGDVIEQIPTRCLSEFIALVPVCFGAGAIPGPGSTARVMFNIGSAVSFSQGNTLDFGFGGGGGSRGGFGPPYQPPGPPFQPPTVEPGAGPVSQPPTGQPPSGPAGPVTQPVGLVARLPAAALLWAGAVLLLLAAGLMLGPSLRHARSR